MKVRFWGTRGSIAKPGPTTQRYGGNTSCVEVRSRSGTLIVLDGGTGAHELGQQLVAQGGVVDGHMLISHTHWDHIQGIPFFAPLYRPGNTWDIYGPGGVTASLKATLAGQMEHTYFPITTEHFAATIRYHDLVEGSFSVGDFNIVTRYLNHPALTLGYRIEADGATLVYCCDHEPHSRDMAAGDKPLTGMDRRYADFVAGADLVIHDSQYTAKEYPDRVGWGHSPVEYAVRVCQEAGVRQLALTHYDPTREDAAVDRIIESVHAALRDSGSTLQVLAAAEGLVLEPKGAAAGATRTDKSAFAAHSALDAGALRRPVLLYVRDTGIMARLKDAAGSEGIPCQACDSVEELERRMAQGAALVFIEHNAPRTSGLEVAAKLRKVRGGDAAQVPLVLVTNDPAAVDNGAGLATDWLVAPFTQSYARTKIRAWVLRAACRWARARLPPDEEARLGALRKLAILDTPPEPRFDRLTHIAANALNVPIALVSLVDRDRQWFKSCLGLSVRETSRDVAFCAHVVHEKKEMMVVDTLLDDRFAENPLVVGEPRIRAYTGMPLFLADGSCIGTFCVIDIRPRHFNEDELATLRELRDLVVEEIKRSIA